MKMRSVILSGVLFFPACTLANTFHPVLCETIKYRVFGEPSKTIKDCGDSPNFYITINLNNHYFDSAMTRIELPFVHQEIVNGQQRATTIQVLEAKPDYLIRIQIITDGKTMMSSFTMKPGDKASRYFDNDLIDVSFNKQAM